jgi:UDP-N-acetyl-2-amino-2-deoxyglucuronate dehydrogenase
MTIRLGLIGCGRIADKHIRTIASVSAVRLVAVSDISEERMQSAENAYQGQRGETEAVKKYKDYHALIEDHGVDAVVITTLSGLHARIALAAIHAGKPVMVEKPIALTLREADEIIACSAQLQVPVLVCHQLRYRPLFAELNNYLHGGGFGRMLYGAISLRIRRDADYYASAPWRGSWEHDGGMLTNQGIHLLDLLLWYMGDAESVNGRLIRIPCANKETEDAAVATIRFAAGPAGVMDANTVSHPGNLEQSLHLFGEKGTVAIGGEAFNRIVRWEIPGFPRERAEALLADASEHQHMYEDFIQAVAYGKKPVMNAAEGKKGLELIFAIYQSHLEKRSTTLPAGDFSPAEFRKSEVWS